MNLMQRQQSSEQQELEALTEQLVKMKQLLTSEKEQSHAAHLEVERALVQSEEKCHHLEHSLSSLQTQIATQNGENERLQSELQAHREECKQQQILIAELRPRVDELNKALADSKHLSEQQAHDAEVCHQAALDQLHALQQVLESDKEERLILLDKIAALDQEIAKTHKAYETLHEDYVGAASQRDNANESLARRDEELETARRTIQEHEQALRQFAAQSVQRGQKIEGLVTQLEALERDKQKLEEGYTRTRRTLEEREQDIKVAQQHLAKKVKEVSRLTEHQEETDRKADRLQKELQDCQNQLELTRGELGKLQRREKQLQDQLHEQANAMEARSARWEAEHHKLMEQVKRAEIDTKKLRETEDKLHHVRALLGEAEYRPEVPKPTMIIGEALAPPQLNPVPGAPEAVEVGANVEAESEHTAPKPPIRIRQNLFDK